MRLVGLVLVTLGALVLGMEGFGHRYWGRTEEPGPAADRVSDGDTGWVPPILGGIAVVGGLLMLTTDSRRE